MFPRIIIAGAPFLFLAGPPLAAKSAVSPAAPAISPEALSLPPLAQAPKPPRSAAELLSLSECLERALKNSPQRVAGILAAEKAQKALKEYTAKRLPHLWALSSMQQSNNDSIQNVATNYDFLHLDQSITPFSPAWKTGTQRRKQLEAAIASRIATKLDVELLVKSLYFSVLQSSDSIAVMDHVEHVLNRLEGTVLPRYTIGRAPPFDLINVRTRLSNLKLNRGLTRSVMNGGWELLALIIGKGGREELRLYHIPALPPVPPDEDVLHNPTLESLRAGVRAAEWGVRAMRAQWYPQMHFGLDYGYGGIEAWRYKGMLNEFAPAWGNGGQVDFNLTQQIFNWGEINARIAQTKKDLAIAKMNYKNQYQTLRRDYISARLRALAHARDDRRRRTLFSDAKLSTDTSIDRYQREATSILEPAAAVGFLLQNFLTERNDYYSYLTDVATVERLIGRDIVSYGKAGEWKAMQ